MQRTPGGGGRKKRVTGGGGNVFKRGEGINGGSRPSAGSSGGAGRGSGNRAGGSNLGLIALILSLVLGKGNNGKKGGLLKRIIVLIIILAIASSVIKCMAGGVSGMSGMVEDYTSQQGSYEDNSDLAMVETQPEPTPQPALAPTQEAPADTSVSNQARDKRTRILGGGKDTYTIMVYMCGTDLESNYGMATADLNEMLHADISDNVNIIIETGGTKKWQNTVISNKTNQIYQIKNDGIARLQSDIGKKPMTKASTLTEFIDYCETNFPANRYALIMWDHGGGSTAGYGYDEQFPNTAMTLDVFNKALKDAGCVFDFIGFDACLMATLETALVAEQYADYFIASEETEPGCGWYYTDWLTALSKNPSMSTVEIGENIIDDFVDVCRKNAAGDKTTLSIVDLAEFAGTVPEVFSDFAASVGDLLDNEEYAVVSTARGNAREFGSSAQINHVDLVHLAKGIGTDEAKALTEAILGCVKYNRTSKAMTNSYGMSIYFPYDSFKSVNSAMSLYSDIGMDRNYSSCIKSFASLAAGGQIATGTTSSPLGSLLGSFTGTSSSSSSSDVLGSLLSGALGSGSGSGGSDLLTSIMGSDYSSWFDSGRVLAMGDYYDEHAIYSDDMLLTDKNGGKVLSLSDDKWELVKDIQLNVFVDDGEGFIDLGMDNVYEFDGDGDLVIDYDGTWLAINDNIVAYYMESYVTDGDDYVITGRIPALLNGELVYIMVVFDNETPENENGYVVGARYIYDEGETDTVGKGLIELKYGDRIDFVCDYYTYDGEYEASYLLGETFIVNGELTISNVPVGDVDCVVTYCLTDIYANEFWTESLIF